MTFKNLFYLPIVATTLALSLPSTVSNAPDSSTSSSKLDQETIEEKISNQNMKNVDSFHVPLDFGQVSSGYGYRNVSHGSRFHQGIDFAVPYNNFSIHGKRLDIKAANRGVVDEVGEGPGYGKYVQIAHPSSDSTKLKTVYGHLSDVHVEEGDTVKAKSHIGDMGNTGSSNNYHLHFEALKKGPSEDRYSAFDPKGNFLNYEMLNVDDIVGRGEKYLRVRSNIGSASENNVNS